MAFGDQIMELLQSRDMTQKELAKALSLPVTTLNGYVRGHREPDYETLQRFADYFGVSCDYLLDYSVNKEYQTRLPRNTGLSGFAASYVRISANCWSKRHNLWTSRTSAGRTKRNKLPPAAQSLPLISRGCAFFTLVCRLMTNAVYTVKNPAVLRRGFCKKKESLTFSRK